MGNTEMNAYLFQLKKNTSSRSWKTYTKYFHLCLKLWTDRQFVCNVTVWILYHSEQFGAFILVKIVYYWPPLWSALRQKCSHLFGSPLSSPWACWKVWTLPSSTQPPGQKHTCIHTVFPFFFALSPLSLPFLSYSASPGCMCQWHSAVLCGGPTSSRVVSPRVLLLSIDIDRAFLCVPESVPLTVSLFFYLFTQYTSPFVNLSVSSLLSFSPPLHLTLIFLFTLPLFCILIFQSAELSLWVSVFSVGRPHVERSIQSFLYTVYSLPRCNYRFVSTPYPALKGIVFKWDMRC